MALKTIVKNRQAYHNYEIVSKIEAGIVLQGTEVKSIRAGKANLQEAWVGIDSMGEAFLKQAHISPYSHGNINNHDGTRPRKLLLKRRELDKLAEQVERKGYSLIPLSLYLRGQVVKLEIGLGKGKKAHDKRESSKEKDAEREIARALKTSKNL